MKAVYLEKKAVSDDDKIFEPITSVMIIRPRPISSSISATRRSYFQIR